MLKGKRSVSACSLSSCRIRAEALARAFNNRIWPCVWVSQRSSVEGDDGMPNGIDDEEEFFDASPSPVEAEDESLFCQQHSSAATEAGRAKLYELLQQHATDDAIDVFYDVSEDAGLTDTASDTCLRDDESESEHVDKIFESSCCGLSDEECGFSCKSDLKENELMISSVSQSRDSASSEAPDCLKSQLRDGERKEIDIDPSTRSGSNCENCHCLENKEEERDDGSENLPNGDHESEENESARADEGVKSLNAECSDTKEPVAAENEITDENGEDADSNEMTKHFDLASESATTNENENVSNSQQVHTDDDPESPNAEKISKGDDESHVAIEVTAEIESPSSSPADAKVTSPTSRLQVFDESRPKISRSTSLKTGKTPPGTPSRKKIVRFADVLGLDLEDVRHIMTGDLPNIPSSAYTDLNLKDTELPTCEPISETIEISRRDSGSWKSMPAATATNVLYPMFPVPGEQRDFMDRVRSQRICLQTVLISEMSVQCTCKVMNYGYQKKVMARYTVNDWQTSNDIDASYIAGSSDGETDSFAFSIFLSPQNKNVKFALKYEVNGKEYWDNNKNQNYCLSYHGSFNMQQLPTPLWQDQFW